MFTLSSHKISSLFRPLLSLYNLLRSICPVCSSKICEHERIVLFLYECRSLPALAFCSQVNKKRQDFITPYFDDLLLYTCCTDASRKFNSTHEWRQWIVQGSWRRIDIQFNRLKPSGHYMYRTVVTVCTTSLTFNNSTFCPQTIFMCFVWISEQTAIISLYSINWLIFVTEI